MHLLLRSTRVESRYNSLFRIHLYMVLLECHLANVGLSSPYKSMTEYDEDVQNSVMGPHHSTIHVYVI